MSDFEKNLEKLRLSKADSPTVKAKKIELSKMVSLPEYMANLYFNELKLSDNKKDSAIKEKARLLGLNF